MTMNAAAIASDTTGHVRPGVLSLSIKEKSALFAAYMPFIKGGGLFIPTNKQYKMGEEVFMLLTLMDDPAKLPVSGKVVWVTPTGAHGSRTQGVGVQFAFNESGKAAQHKIEGLLGGSLKSVRPTHTM
jgi:type IV pilus assembly protein PilZ